MRAILFETSQTINVFIVSLITELLALSLVLPAIAQVTSDGTTNTIVNQNNHNFNIINGIEKGSNLFHSFSNFSIPTGSTATFDLTHTPNITTIFSRVTGGNVSQIDGLIQTLNSNNPVSLFLMNPNGIVFGQNAALNIGGSFIGTTANSIKFADGTEFSAVNPTGTPLLTMSVPIGLQMGINSAEIQVNGQGHNVTRVGASLLNRGNTSTGLQVTPGNTLTLVGSDIFLDGGVLSANSGKVELVALHSGQWTLGKGDSLGTVDPNLTSQLGDIQLRSASLVDVSGIFSGAVQMMGQNIRLQDGSIVMGQNFGEQPGRDFQIIGRESITLSGTTPAVSSRIVTQSLSFGKGGDIQVSAPHIALSDGSTIASHTFSSSSTGDLTVYAPETLTLTGFSPLDISNITALVTTTFNTGTAGKVTVFTSTLTLNEGGGVSSATLSKGDGGLVTVNATNLIAIDGISPFAGSGISSISFGPGNAGDIVINVPKLKISNAGTVSSSGNANGNAGNIWVRASDSIDIFNNQIPDPSLPPELIPLTHITSSVYIYPLYLRLLLGLPDVSTGNAGSVHIYTPNLTLTNAGKVTVNNFGTGNGGFIDIHADRITLKNQALISAITASGDGGDINLQTQELLQLRQMSQISTEARNNGDGGNISIQSPILLGLENSDIIANAEGGRGGNINITTQGIIGLEFHNTLTPTEELTNDITASSQFNVNGSVQINNIGIDPNSGLVELPASITDSSQQIASGCSANPGSSFVATGRGGVPQNPTQEIRSDRTWSDLRDISAYRSKEQVQAQMPESPQALVQATSWHRNPNGKIELVAVHGGYTQRDLTCTAVLQSQL
ncbi:S-layer family protein [Tolypothrix sp. FACHB-123]|uniref:two-partner secretion domain-containing protein n=1 Tax=Tolypothrix sp. FACHB-123 TaxID=2692868 RepID=UPI0016851257|nr:S-layer family protein [Tolypothrix sp. FACHB-123]MBD2354518.1 S-layer family protein [Tolypothrix sp. FACHB-123]